MMGKKTTKVPQITVGYRVGKIEVLEPTSGRKSGYTIWRCKCDCRNELLLDTRKLQRGMVRDCGCVSRVAPGQKDLTGVRFGHLVCTKPTDQRSKSGSMVWQCKCDCGSECFAVSTQLTKGYKKSCGCLSHPPLKDYIGKRFGQLTVTRYHGKTEGAHRWECLCDCGNTTIVHQTLLQSGKTKSCGCLQATIIRDNMKFVDGTSVTSLEKASTRLISSNSSGYNGVYLNKKTQKWIAQISFKGKTYYLGSYSKIEEAVTARKKAEARMYGEFLAQYREKHPDRSS